MKHEQLIEALEPIEARYKQDYTDQEREIMYKRFFWMTGGMFTKLCGIVLAAGQYRIPAVDDFTKMQNANPEDFKRIKRMHADCDDCNGTGYRMFLQRRRDKKHVAPAARCDCLNGENYHTFPSIEQAEKAEGFFRWLSVHEPPFDAIMKADKMSGVWRERLKAKEETVEFEAPVETPPAGDLAGAEEAEPENEIEIDDNIPF